MHCDNCQTEVTPSKNDPGKYYCPVCVAVFEITDTGTKAIDLDPLSAMKNKQGDFDARLVKLEKANKGPIKEVEPDDDPEIDDDEECGIVFEFGGDE